MTRHCHTPAMQRNASYLFPVAALALLTLSSPARNVDLSTVPPRASVELTIYNGEDITLVRENRTLTVKRGLNKLQFSWADTLIDPTSVELTFPGQEDKVEILETTFPHDKPQQLSWTIESDLEGDAKAEISYFTAGIRWNADYVIMLAEDGSTASVEGFVRVDNNSGEEYANATVRLVVGAINLVDEIEDLARRGISPHGLLRKALAADALPAAAYMNRAPMVVSGALAEESAAVGAVEKEALSEYHIFALPGTQTIPDRQGKRMRFVEAPETAITGLFRYRPQQYGDEPVRVLLFRNSPKNKGLGESPLPNGDVRVFARVPNNGLRYVGKTDTLQVPVEAEMEVVLGSDPDFRFRSDALSRVRERFVMRLKGVAVYQELTEGNIKPEPDSRLVGFDLRSTIRHRIINGTGEPQRLEVRLPFRGDVSVRGPDLPGLHKQSADAIEYAVEIPAASRRELTFETVERFGRNRKSGIGTSVEIIP